VRALIFAAVLVLSAVPMWGADAQSGDWIVSGEEFLDSASKEVSGRVVVEGSLVLRNATLTAVEIEVTGSLVAYNSTISADVSSEGHLELHSTDIMDAGVQVSEGTFTMQGSEVHGSTEDGVSITGGSYHMIIMSSIRGNRGYGVYISTNTTVELRDTTVSSNGMDGVHAVSGTLTVVDCEVSANSGHGIHIQDALPGSSVVNTTVSGNSGWGVRLVNREVQMVGLSCRDNGLGDLALFWDLTVDVRDAAGGTAGHAVVTVEDSAGNTYGPVDSGEDGAALFRDVVVYTVAGGREDRTPFTITASVDGTSGTTTVKGIQSEPVEVRIEMPDLMVSSVHCPTSVTLGKEYEVTAVVSNIGGVSAENITVYFYADSALIGKRSVAVLEPETSQEVYVRWTPEEKGRVVLSVRVDPEDAVKEVSEDNNRSELTVSAEESLTYRFAVPILLLIGILGMGAIKLYNWVRYRRAIGK